MERALITDIQGYSIHDGPGIRTVVFFKGCSLHCRWCANPENISPKQQMGFVDKLCQCCGRCAKACKEGAIIPGEGVYRIDRDKCTACGDCLETCYYDALTRYGEEKTSEEVFKAVERDKMFYRRSGGGVTVSGGEPLLHPAFVRELFEQCHRAEINTAVETCGFVPKEAFEEVLPVTDLFLFDLKQMDSERHEYWTGGKNERMLENARMVVEAGAKVLFRQPIIPGVNDNLGNICATADFMKSLGSGGMDIQLMPYHRMGQSKYAALNQPYGMGDVSVFTAEQVEEFCRAYIAAGVNCSISK